MDKKKLNLTEIVEQSVSIRMGVCENQCDDKKFQVCSLSGKGMGSRIAYQSP